MRTPQHPEAHFVNRMGWLRAAVLGANDGLLSTTSLVIGVAAASGNKRHLLITAFAGVISGAFSMAAGEYVSVSSQVDTEQSDLERERKELAAMPDYELNELKSIYMQRGLREDTALEVARQLTQKNALAAHVRDELGISKITMTNPLTAAFASACSFISGGIIPFAVCYLFPMQQMVYAQYAFAIIFLIILGIISARLGGSSVRKGVIRISFWGTVAMVTCALIGHLFGTNIS